MALSRRRFIAVAAASGALAARPARAFRLDPVEWRGVAMGASASLTIHHEDRALAMGLLAAALAEVERLERLFSLYRPDSALVRLNREGRLEAPPMDLIALLAAAGDMHALTEGAFDPTVHPLWQLHATHFAQPGADPAGPPAQAVEEALAGIGWNGVDLASDAVAFRRPGMGITLNGIAQGHVTDRIALLLRRGGMRHVLVNMGEIRAIGGRGDGRDWRVAAMGRALGLSDGAVAVSSPDATRFSPTCHHLFDPKAGRSAASPPEVTVVAETATQADALSTALAVAPGLLPRLRTLAGVVKVEVTSPRG